MAMPRLLAFYLPRVLVPDRCKIEDTVKEAIQCIMRERPVSGVKREQGRTKEKIGKSAEEWHFTLRERLR